VTTQFSEAYASGYSSFSIFSTMSDYYLDPSLISMGSETTTISMGSPAVYVDYFTITARTYATVSQRPYLNVTYSS
jgi:hypothetical protein